MKCELKCEGRILQVVFHSFPTVPLETVGNFSGWQHGSYDPEPAEHLRKVLERRVRSFSSSEHLIISLKKYFHPSPVSSSLTRVQTGRLLLPFGPF